MLPVTAVRTQPELDAALILSRQTNIRIESAARDASPILMVDVTSGVHRIEVLPRAHVRRVRVSGDAKLELVLHAQASLASLHLYGDGAARVVSAVEWISEVTAQENACLEASLDGTHMLLTHKSIDAIAYVELSHGAHLKVPDNADTKGLVVLRTDMASTVCPKLSESHLRAMKIDPNDETGFYVMLRGVGSEHALARRGTKPDTLQYVDSLREDLNLSREIAVSYPFTRARQAFGEDLRFSKLNEALARYQPLPSRPQRQPRFAHCTSW